MVDEDETGSATPRTDVGARDGGPASVGALVLAAAGVAVGMQTLRTAFPYVEYLLYSRLGVPPAVAMALAVPVFAAGGLFPPLARRAGPRRTLLGAGSALALARFAMQAWRGDPTVDMALAFAGTAAFFVFLPALAACERAAERTGGPSAAGARLAAGIALGLAVDASLNGAFLTYDYAWQPGAAGLALAALLSGALLGALAARSRSFVGRGIGGARVDAGCASDAGRASDASDTDDASDVSGATLPWSAVGAAIFLELAVFENAARASTATGASIAVAILCVTGGQVLGAAVAASWVPSRRAAVAVAAVLCATLLPFASAPLALSALVVGQAALAALLARLLSDETAEAPPRARSCALFGVVAAALVGLSYVPQGANLFLSVWHVYVLAAATLGLFAVAARAPRVAAGAATDAALSSAPPFATMGARVAFAACALAAGAPAFAVALAWAPPRTASPTPGDRPLRVVSYNVHKGFDVRGDLGLEAIARAVEAERPDVVALQEVSRGQITESDVDMASWLSRRLDLPVLYSPSGTPVWGQAVLTRLPVTSAENHLLEPLDLPTARSYCYLEIDAGWSEPLRLVNTHYTARFGQADRVAHSEALARTLRERGLRRTLLVGDLNAIPDSPPLRVLVKLGLEDAGAKDATARGAAAASTAPATDPIVRIDYVLHSPDIVTESYTVGEGLASDHRSVAVTVRPQ